MSAVSADDAELELVDGVTARDRAIETQDERDWRQALLHLERAVALRSTGESQFELAEVCARLQLWAEAYGAYEAALGLGINGRAEARARAFVSNHAADMAALDLVGPSGAAVYVGERWRGRLPLARPLAVTKGSLTLRLELSGFRHWKQQLTLSAGQHARLEVSLEPEAAALPPAVAAVAASAAADGDAGQPPWVMPALLGGASVFVASGAAFAISSLLLPDARRELRASCGSPLVGGECRGTIDAEQAAAQSAANRILTLETLRWVAVGGAAVGLTSAAIGLLGMQSGSAASAASARLNLDVSGNALHIDIRAHF